MSYYRTLREFLSDTRKVVFSTNETVMKNLDDSDLEGWELVECTHQGMVYASM